LFWFASKTNNKSALWGQRNFIESDRRFTGDRLLPAALIWGSGIRIAEIEPPKDLMWVAKGAMPVALMRTSWTDPNAIFVGFKGGRATISHAHIDAGSFVMEANGVRWASDFGMENYNRLETSGVDLWNMRQNSQRWTVFRDNNMAHNTLTVNDQLHVVTANSEIVSHSSTPSFMNAIVDLSKVFEGQLAKSSRGVAIVDGQYVVVRDELATNQEATIRWTMMTTAEVAKVKKNSIELKKDGKRLTLQVAEPAKVTMKTWSTVSPNEWDSQNPGTSLIGFEVKLPANTSQTLLVKLIPHKAKNTKKAIPALSLWEK
jgi:hypothetical protein